MNSATENRFGPWPLAAAVVLTALTGCDEAFLADKPSRDTASDTRDEGGKIELLPDLTGPSQRDVEAPDVFQVTEVGLWDGRPSLGGIWVAHPDVSQPERVRITNPKTKKSVTGALFRRERNLPGPILQVSSSAAEKLGMLPGAPERLEVVALRREKIEPPQPEPAAEPADASPDAASAKTDDAVPQAEASAGEKPPKRKWWQKKAPEDVAADVSAEAAAAGVAAASSATEATASTAAETAATAGRSSATLTDPVVAPPQQKPAKRKWWQKKPADEITETPLDPIAGAAAAIEASEPTQAATKADATASNLSKPFVQIGTFGLEANARTAAEKVSANGFSAQVQKITSDGKPVWRVLVGPAATRAERRAILGDMKDLGFSDAFIAKK